MSNVYHLPSARKEDGPEQTAETPEAAAQADAEVQAGASRPADPVPPASNDDGWSAGRKLFEARERLGLSLDELAERTKVRRNYLEALEVMDAKLLPGRAYAVAYLRSYAKALDLDEDAIVQQYQEECALSREDVRPQLRAPDSRPRRERPWLAAALLGLVAGGFVVWRAMDADRAVVVTPAQEQAAGAAVAAVDPNAPVDPHMAALRTLEIRALQSAWLEVRGPDGTIFFSGTLEPGQAYRPDPGPGWTMHARDGGSFMLYVDGREVGLLGDAGKPVLGKSVDSVVAEEPAAIAQAE